MNQRNILAILGGPRTNGLTAAMLDCAIGKAEKSGCKVNRIDLYEKNIAFCTGCRACINTQSCVQNDDIREIETLIRESDTIILAAPVYWANVPAAVKNLFDRLLGTAMEETAAFPKPRLKGKEYILLTACNTPAPFSWIYGQSRGALRNMREFFKTAGMKPIGNAVCTNAANQKELPRHIVKKIERFFR